MFSSRDTRLSAEHLAAYSLDCLAFAYEMLSRIDTADSAQPEGVQRELPAVENGFAKLSEEVWNLRSLILNVIEKQPGPSEYRRGPKSTEIVREEFFGALVRAGLFWRLSQVSSVDSSVRTAFRAAEEQVNDIIAKACSRLRELELGELTHEAVVIERSLSEGVSIAEAERRERVRWEDPPD